jgi:2-polyprenyl-3-methyl-5-hydroxy-6-metoxy-1,4-benzoquinol methylase
MSDLPWNQKFDMIVYADVLEHVLYPKLVLNKFDQYLNKG